MTTHEQQPAPAEVRGQVEHTADGTLVRGTSRSDREIAEVLKTNGFRWSRNLDAWYLPRTWGEATRAQRVKALQATLREEVEVLVDLDQPRRSAAERAAERRERAEQRAERMDARAEAAAARAAAADAERRRIQDAIPFGQPVLVGHHSQRRHERALDRMERNLYRAAEESERAEDARAAADRARKVAAGAESKVTIGNRIERNEAEARRIRRRLQGAEGTYRRRLELLITDLDDQLALDRAKLDEAGGVEHSRETVRPGDFVRIRGHWYTVVRSNPKTVTVPSPLAAADSKWTDTAPWREVTAHLPRAEATADHVRALAAGTSPAFPGLRARLEQQAELLGG